MDLVEQEKLTVTKELADSVFKNYQKKEVKGSISREEYLEQVKNMYFQQYQFSLTLTGGAKSQVQYNALLRTGYPQLLSRTLSSFVASKGFDITFKDAVEERGGEFMDVLHSLSFFDDFYTATHDMCRYGVCFWLMYEDDTMETEHKIRFASLPPEQMAVWTDGTVDENILLAVRKYKRDVIDIDGISIKSEDVIEAYDDTNMYIYAGENEEVSEPHGFDKVPVYKMKLNDEELVSYDPAIDLINSHAVIMSTRIEDKVKFVNAILVASGVMLTSMHVKALRETGILSGLGENADMKYVTKTFQEADLQVLQKSLEDNIHNFAMIPNFNNPETIGNASGVALRMKLENFIILADGVWRSILPQLKHVVVDLLSKTGYDIIKVEDMTISPKFNLPNDDLVLSQVYSNFGGSIPVTEFTPHLSIIEDANELNLEQQEQGGSTNGIEGSSQGSIDGAMGSRTTNDPNGIVN